MGETEPTERDEIARLEAEVVRLKQAEEWLTTERNGYGDMCQQLKDELEELGSAVNETLELADNLNDIASKGAGYSEHWGERVMQAVQPLRDTAAFAGRTLAHNRSLLEHNGKLIERIAELEATIREQGDMIVSTAIERDDARIRLENQMRAARARSKANEEG